MSDAPTESRPETTDRVVLYPRYDETFPVLTRDEIDRLRRFGDARSYRDSEALFLAGTPAPGMFIVLSAIGEGAAVVAAIHGALAAADAA